MSEIQPMSTSQIAGLFVETVDRMGPPNRSTMPLLPPGTPMAARVEHTLLRFDAGNDDVLALCRQAEAHGLRGVCVNPRDVALCVDALSGTGVMVVSVVDFPLGCGMVEDVIAQTTRVIAAGAAEVDMVMDVRSVKNGDGRAAERVAAVVAAAGGVPIKVILETGSLTEAQIVHACAIAWVFGASFVKTSTGYGARGATTRDVEIMRAAVGSRLRIKASGGIRNRHDALALIAAGADVIGTSNGPACI